MSDDTSVNTWSFVSLPVGPVRVGPVMGALTRGVWGTPAMPMGGMTGEYTSSDVGGRPTSSLAIIAVVAGVLSVFAMRGYVVGAIAAIVGGALALQPARGPSPPRSV